MASLMDPASSIAEVLKQLAERPQENFLAMTAERAVTGQGTPFARSLVKALVERNLTFPRSRCDRFVLPNMMAVRAHMLRRMFMVPMWWSMRSQPTMCL